MWWGRRNNVETKKKEKKTRMCERGEGGGRRVEEGENSLARTNDVGSAGSMEQQTVQRLQAVSH
jgi:hypothetical protein